MKAFVFLVVGILLSITGYGQVKERYLILLKNKDNSPYSINKPAAFLSPKSIARRVKQNIAVTSQDLPVNPDYVTQLKATGAKVIFTSRWFNGIVVEVDVTQLAVIKNLPFFKGIELNKPIYTTDDAGITRISNATPVTQTLEGLDYGKMKNQIQILGADYFHEKNIRGENMLIGVFDNGFSRMDQLKYFSKLFEEKRIIDTYDFVARETNVFNDGAHGTNTLSTIAAYEPGSMIGVAPKAAFALYQTENNGGESPYEEVTWLIAAEKADSLGVDIISSSLGYNYFSGKYNTKEYNYSYADMDGNTTIVSRAARFASRKGILVVNSAGNEGNNSWKYIIAPADVDSVFSVGATDYSLNYARFSSIGPNAIGQTKPDISAVGQGVAVGNDIGTGSATTSNGTSFSAPQIAGLCALVWQAFPILTAQQVISLIKKSGHLAAKPDNFLGYGVPDLRRIEAIFEAEYRPLATTGEEKEAIIIAPNPITNIIQLQIPAYLVGEKAKISIYTNDGTLVTETERELSKQTFLPFANSNAGLYLLKLEAGTIRITKKFVKQ